MTTPTATTATTAPTEATATTATTVLDAVLDPGSFWSWDTAPDRSEHSREYQDQLQRATSRTRVDESIVTGEGRLDDRPVAVIASDFRFLAGSIGQAAADRILAAVRRATSRSLPLLAFSRSGGTRMQEGTAAFVRMIDVARVIATHTRAGNPYLAWLGNPTTGGVLASWGSQGHLTFAEPHALVGFIGPRVFAAMHGEPFPDGVQVAENLAARGIVDDVATAEHFRTSAGQALRHLLDPPSRPALPRPALAAAPTRSTWDSVLASRDPARPGPREVLRLGGTETVELDRQRVGKAVIAALTRLDGQPCVFVGHDREAQRAGVSFCAADLILVRRAAALAQELSLPFVSMIDTPGAELSPQAEHDGIAREIARCVAELGALTVPTVCILMGEGAGGGALALLPAQRVVAAENAWLSPLPPEGASSLVHGDVRFARDTAEQQRIGAFDLQRMGIVHRVVREDHDPVEFATRLAAEAAAQVRELYCR